MEGGGLNSRQKDIHNVWGVVVQRITRTKTWGNFQKFLKDKLNTVKSEKGMRNM